MEIGYIKKKNELSNEIIFELREKGMSYERIADYYNEKGIKVTVGTIERRCKKAYEKRKKKIPNAKIKIEVLDEEIYQLREKGMSYERIVEYYRRKGIKITHQSIGYRCKKIYKEKGKEEPKIKIGKRKQNKRKEESLEDLDMLLNKRLEGKIKTGKELMKLKDKERNTEGAEK